MITSCIISEQTPRTTKICHLAHTLLLVMPMSYQDRIRYERSAGFLEHHRTHGSQKKGQSPNVFIYHPANRSKKAKLLAVFVKHIFLIISSQIRIQIGQTSTGFIICHPKSDPRRKNICFFPHTHRSKLDKDLLTS